MYEIRIHGRGGQGAVTAVNILAKAAYYCGLWPRAFPLYGPERRGAPVAAYLRLDHQPVRLKCLIDQPDLVAVIDPKLAGSPSMLSGLKEGGILLLNSAEPSLAPKLTGPVSRLATVNATQIAKEILGRPITNTVMLGAFARVYEPITLEAVLQAIKETFSGQTGEINARAAEIAYQQTQVAAQNLGVA